MLGPIDYIVVGFEGDNFDGSILDALSEATESGVIRVVDLVFVMKDGDGNVVLAEIQDQSDELKEMYAKLGFDDEMPLMTEDDVMKIGESMENDTSAGVLVIEQLWAKDLKKALLDANGTLLDEGRIHADVVEEVVAGLGEVEDEE